MAQPGDARKGTARASVYEDGIIALSLANLCYARVWRSTVFVGQQELFAGQARASLTELAVLTASVVVLGAVLWPVVRLARSAGRRGEVIAGFVFLSAAAFVLNSLNGLLPYTWNLNLAQGLGLEAWSRIRVAIVTILPIFMVVVARRWAVRATAAVLLVLSPFLLVTFGRTIHAATIHVPQHAHSAPARLKQAPMRVAWVIFDDWDYRLSFPDRPGSLELPNLDHAVAESLTTTQAVSPGPETVLSVPALLAGRAVSRFEAVSDDAARVWFQGEQSGRLYTSDLTIFSEVNSKGYSSAAVGWYLPYCSLFGRELAACAYSRAVSYVGFHRIPPPKEKAASRYFMSHLDALLAIDGYDFEPLERLRREDFAGEFRSTLAQATHYIVDPSLDFVFLHLAMPHPPGICSQILSSGCPANDYFGNLRVMDMAIGELRGALADSGLERRTAIMFTSDHPCMTSRGIDGKSDPRVPFLVHMPGQAQKMVHGDLFHTVRTRDLALSLLEGNLHSASDVAAWMSRRPAPDTQSLHSGRPLGDGSHPQAGG